MGRTTKHCREKQMRRKVATMKLALLLIPLTLAYPPLIRVNGPLPPADGVMRALQSEGALIFTGLGEEYGAALASLSKKAPYCLEGRDGLTAACDDGSERLTVARDTVSDIEAFPECVRLEADVVSDAFDRVENVFSQLMRRQFGKNLDVLGEDRNVTKLWEEFDTKTQLHVYRKNMNKVTSSPLALPYHTDNGMYALVTPSSILPLRTIDKRGEVSILDSGLYAAPHGLPALSTMLSPSPRTVMARMQVAPPNSLPSSATLNHNSEFFSTHLLAPLITQTGPTLQRLIQQRSQGGNSDCSQYWPYSDEP